MFQTKNQTTMFEASQIINKNSQKLDLPLVLQGGPSDFFGGLNSPTQLNEFDISITSYTLHELCIYIYTHYIYIHIIYIWVNYHIPLI